MSSILYNPLNINGVISTDKTALQNLNDLCSAAGCFLTFDVSQGKWAVIINTTGSSIKSFNDSNIIGSINVSETGVNELYNSISYEYPNKDLQDQTDFIELSIAAEDRYPNEVDNTLNVQSALINNAVQAQYLAGIELKQSRLSKIITFTTDYTSLGLKAGDLIDVTSEMYGYTNKVFRVTKLEENDEDTIGIVITALEYDADVYSTADLVAVQKSKKTGILLKQQNEEIQKAEDANVAGSIGRMIAINAGLGIANNLLNKLFGRRQIGTDANGNPIYDNKTKPNDEDTDKVLANAKRPSLTAITSSATAVCEGNFFVITVSHTCSSCLFDIPDFDYPYEITGVFEEDIDVPLTGVISVSGSTRSGSLTINTLDNGEEDEKVLTITVGGLTKAVNIWDFNEDDLTATKDNATITEGGTVVVTLSAIGSLENATVPYAITGTASGKVITPALTGEVETVNGTASLTIETNDDGTYQGTQGLTVTFGTASSRPCGDSTASTSITVLDNDAAPPTPTPATTCSYVSVPLVWCGSYNGDDNQLQAVTIRKSVNLPVALAGEATVQVPLTLTVTKGNPSTIAVATYATVAASSALGGIDYKIITSFNTVAPKGLITGTTTTVVGYD